MNSLDPKYYSNCEAAIWTGRKTSVDNEYWYQAVELIDAMKEDLDETMDYGLIGYECEEGVRRNQGRVGAKDGPDSIRRQLAKTAWHHKDKVGDLGNIVCHDEHMEETQTQLATLVAKSIDKDIFPIVMGGGHDVAFGTGTGVLASEKAKGKRIGIVNFDAHFDLRPVVDQGNSGTPFNQLLNAYTDRLDYLVLGIQSAANTKSLFNIADHHNVEYLRAHNCIVPNFDNISKSINAFANKVDLIHITIDLDGFSSAYAPGVSAPSPMGMEPLFVQRCLDLLKSTNKVIALDIAELNPKYDRDNCTAKLAARLVDSWI